MSYFSKRFIVLCITVNLKDVQRIVKFMIDDQKIERIKNNTKGVDKLVAGGGHLGHILLKITGVSSNLRFISMQNMTSIVTTGN